MTRAVLILSALLATVVFLVGADAARDDSRPQGGEDCNGNGIPDATDIGDGTSQDCNGNGIPDECDTEVTFSFRFISGAANKPRATFIADFDGDSDPDVLSASLDDNKIAWYPNFDGNGLFGGQKVISFAAGGPVSVFAADVDGDGDMDALSASTVLSQVNWYENLDGVGVMWATHTISTFVANAFSVFAIDADGDGDVDVFSASQDDNKIAWYENLDGQGTFGGQRVITTLADIALAVHAADVDGDGDVDALSAAFGGNEFAWYENSDGEGIFGAKQVISTAGVGAAFIDLADLDGDGDGDLLGASNLDGEISWFEKLNGVDAFGPQRLIDGTAAQALWVAAADFDADGDVDVVSASLGNDRVAWYENLDGAGTFGPPRIITSVAFEATSSVPGDIDGDGDMDVVVTSQLNDTIAWYENESDDCDGDRVPDECEPDCNANGRADACDIELGSTSDCNGNGVPDECDVNGGGSDDCAQDGVPDECEADCNGNRQADSCDIEAGRSDDCDDNGVPDECEADCNGNQQVDACDIAAGTSKDCSVNGIPDECEPDCNGNRKADSCDLRQGTSLDCNNNEVPDECDSGTTSLDCDADDVPDECRTRLTFTQHTISTLADFPRSVFAADLDSDGDADVLSASVLDDKVAWYENTDGQGTFGAQQIIVGDRDLPLSVLATDLDGDSALDVLSASFGDDKIAWYAQTPQPGVFESQQVISATANGAQSVWAADLDGDSDEDVLSAAFLSNELAWYENLDGKGSFGAPRILSTESSALFSVSAADVDSDLDIDVLAASFDDDTIAWYENLDGQGTFGPRRIVSSAADGATFVVGADLDGDGDTDLASAAQLGDEVAWYENLDGSGTFGPPQVLAPIANGATSVHATDVDGDGRVDLLAASFFDNRIWIARNDGNGGFGPLEVIDDTAVGAYSVYAIDIDGDGDIDPLSASQEDDTIAWYENESEDCNGNTVPDNCDIVGGVSLDCTGNGVPDECERDCNGNGSADSCDVFGGSSDDCNGDGVPDECQVDCNDNGVMDSCDLLGGGSLDCNNNDVPDECDVDCNGNGKPDDCDISGGQSSDCNQNDVPDECDFDCNGNGEPDDCDVDKGTSDDCDANLVPDECDPDCNADGTPNACDLDCNFNRIPDGCEADCNENGVPDDCDIEPGPSTDCNANQLPDECEIACEVDCDTDGDRCADELDAAPLDPNACTDSDFDGCDDCSSGAYDPFNDGTDADADGFCDATDCDAGNHTVWAAPGPARSLLLSGSPMTLLTWEQPLFPGALLAQFDVLRSPLPHDFLGPVSCIVSDQLETLAEDGDVVPSGVVFHYLIRAENACPGTPGSMGVDSTGSPRSGAPCP